MTRYELWMLNEDHLAEIAYRAVHYKNMEKGKFFVVCIDVEDPTWTSVVDYLMPDEDWQKYRDAELHPVARGSVLREGMEGYLKTVCPGIAKAFDIMFPDNVVMSVVMGEGGADIYTVEPKCERSN